MRKQLEKLAAQGAETDSFPLGQRLWATPQGLVFTDGVVLIEWAGEKGNEKFFTNYESFFREHVPCGPYIPFDREYIRKVEEAQKISEQERRRLVAAARASLAAAKAVSAKKARDAEVLRATAELEEAEKHVSPFDIGGVWLNPRLLLKILKVAKEGTIRLNAACERPVLVFGKDIRAAVMPIRQR